MARSIRPFVDRALGGTLDTELRTRRTNGDTFDDIARWLAVAHGVDVTSETIRSWVKDLPPADPEPEAVAG